MDVRGPAFLRPPPRRILSFLCYKPTPTFCFGQCSSPKFLLSIVIAHEAPCDVLCWTVKICKIDYMDAKTIPGPPSIVSMIFAKYHNDTSSTSTVVSGNAKYPYARRRQVRFGIHQVLLQMARTSTKRVPLPSTREDPVDVKFLVVTPNIYGT